MLKMSRKAQFTWGVIWTFIGWGWLDIVGTVFLDARGGKQSALGMTLEAMLACSPGILFLCVGLILLIRAIRNTG
jgi:hypothetical protein